MGFYNKDKKSFTKNLYLESNSEEEVRKVFGGGTLWTWGYNLHGQLCTNDTVNRSSPVQVDIHTRWKQIVGMNNTFVGIKEDHTLWLCGYNNSGELGQNDVTTKKSSPVQVTGGGKWLTASLGEQTVGGIQFEGSLWVWGRGTNGEIGNNGALNQSSPVQVGTEKTWKQFSLGTNHWTAIKTDGTLWSCGYNSSGQLGQDDTTTRSSPVQVGSDTNWKYVAGGGGSTSHMLKTDDTCWGMGLNNFGYVGDGTGTNRSSPVQEYSKSQWKKISFKGRAVGGLKKDGTLWMWGDDSYGATMNNSVGSTAQSPRQEFTGDTRWVNVEVGWLGSFGIKNDGTAWSVGRGNLGGRGDDSVTYAVSSPVQVVGSNRWLTILGLDFETAGLTK